MGKARLDEFSTFIVPTINNTQNEHMRLTSSSMG